MTYLGKNIKKIRTIQKLSQASFGEIFGLSRASIGAYEEGRAEAKLDIIIKIANHFSITVDSLVNKDITVNELSHFNIFEQNIEKKVNIGGELLKNLAFVEVPIIYSHDLLITELLDSKKKSTNSIRLPYVTERHLAILISKNNFTSIAKRISVNDIVVVDQDSDPWRETESEIKYWLIKSEKSLYLGKVKILKNDELIFFPEDSNPISIKKEKISFIFPVDKLISNNPETREEEDDRLKQMEFQINDLYNRL